MTHADSLVYSDILAALARMTAGSRCQCESPDCGHQGRCSAFLEGNAWRARYRTPLSEGGADALDNCEVVCLACHERWLAQDAPD